MGGDQAIFGFQLHQDRAAGLSLTAMAARVPYSRSALAYFETGERTHPADIGAGTKEYVDRQSTQLPHSWLSDSRRG
ncbi:helix-turn-helix domain-containing protein [Nocardia sp. XZ_19_369]|uniref:helix-turn-helix domain-containing protein n=1 Tax=Nocardia sp. XZ_19_369 TaxID=2769487 RepID=UPI0035A3A3D5